LLLLVLLLLLLVLLLLLQLVLGLACLLVPQGLAHGLPRRHKG
jgi:hypothetical protein